MLQHLLLHPVSLHINPSVFSTFSPKLHLVQLFLSDTYLKQKFKKSKQTLNKVPDIFSQERQRRQYSIQQSFVSLLSHGSYWESEGKHVYWLHVLYPSLQLRPKGSWGKISSAHFNLNQGAWGQTSRLPHWHLSQRLHCLLTVLVLGWFTMKVLNHELIPDQTGRNAVDKWMFSQR